MKGLAYAERERIQTHSMEFSKISFTKVRLEFLHLYFNIKTNIGINIKHNPFTVNNAKGLFKRKERGTGGAMQFAEKKTIV